MSDEKKGTLTEEQLSELNKRVEGLKTPAEVQKAVMEYYAEVHGEKVTMHEDRKQDIILKMDDAQLEKFFKGDFDPKEAAKKATEEIQRKYNVPQGEAKKRAEETQERKMTKKQKREKEDKLVAECFSAMLGIKRGYNNFDRLAEAHKKEADYLGHDTPFTASLGDEREKQAMSVTTDTTGGYFAPEIFSTQIYENLERYGLARRFARMIPMESEVLKFPKLTADVTAAVIGEASQITASDITADQLTLQPLKLAVMAGPFSDELMINAEPSIVQILQQSGGRGLAKLEDNNVFIGTSGSYTGLLESSTNRVTMGTGKTAYTDTTFDDLIDMINELDDRYISEAAAFYYPRKLTGVLRKIKNNSNYVWGEAADPDKRTILGFPYRHVTDMSATESVSTSFAVFGDLDNVWVGTRGGIRVDLLTEGTVNSVNLGETASLALRIIEYWDNEIVDTEAFSELRTAAS